MSDDGYDEALSRFHRTGPEFQGWLSNHGPMAADALIRMGHGDDLERWADHYVRRLEEPPGPRWTITDDGWRDPLGDPSRLGDWLQFFDRALAGGPWDGVLQTWWPRLLPGAVAAATHPLIRTGHAVRALREQETPERVDELGQALGYWAARWSPLPRVHTAGEQPYAAALLGLPGVPDHGGARSRLAALAADDAWPTAAGRVGLVDVAAEVPAALDALVDAAVRRYASWADAEPTMLVHMATAPRAAGLVLPALPAEHWVPTLHHAWATSAAIATMYRPHGPDVPAPASPAGAADVLAAAVATGDEHAIKFAEVAAQAHGRGVAEALPAIAKAAALLG